MKLNRIAKLLGILLTLVLLISGLSGVATGQEGDELPPIDGGPIIWYVRSGVQEDIDQVNEAVNAYLDDMGFNAEVRLVIVDRSEFEDRMALINAAFEQYDLALTTQSWVNQYGTNVTNEYLIPLTAYENPDNGEVENLLQEYAPDLWASMPEFAWDAARVNGEVYGIINQQIWVKPFGVSIREDVVEAFELQDELEAVDSYDDLTPIFQTLKDAIDDGSIVDMIEDGENVSAVFATIDLLNPNNFGYDQVAPYSFVHIDDEDLNVVAFTETEEFRQAMHLRREWQVAGFTEADTIDFEQAALGYSAGAYLVDVGRLVKPGGALEQAARYGYSWVEYPIAPIFLSTGGPTATMTGVSTSIEDNPDRVHRVMMFMNMVHTDPVLFNMLAKGLEGEHWNWVDEENLLIELVPDSGYNPNIDWALGNVFNAYYVDPNQVGAWPETQALNAEARPSPALGFVFDRSPVEMQIVSVDGIYAEFFQPLSDGQVEDVDAGIEALNQAMRDNGLGDILDEAQRQLDDWAGK